MKESRKPIGLDASFREVFPRDEVEDADGARYTITPLGLAKPLCGGNEVAFKRLKDPIVVAAAPECIPGPTPHTRKVQPASRSVAAAVKAEDRITEKVAETEAKPAQPAPRIPKRHGGGRRNRSGLSKLDPLCKRIGIPSRGITGYLRDNGFEVVRGNGTQCIRREDYDRIVAFLASNPPPAGLPKTPVWTPERRTRAEATKKANREAREKLAALSSIPAPECPAKVRTVHDDSLPGFTPGTCTVRDAGDQMLVDELRARGWTVTCIKSTEL